MGDNDKINNDEAKGKKEPQEAKALTKSEPQDKASKGKEAEAAQVLESLEDMPPEVRKSLVAFMGMSARYSGPRPNPIFEKFTEAHIDKYLDYIQRDDDNEYNLRKTNRWYYLGYAVLAILVFFIGVAYLLPRDKELLDDLIKIIIVVAGGLGTGYGLSKRSG